MNKIELFGIKIDNLTMEEALENIKGFLMDGRQHYIVLPYSEFVVRAQKDEEFRKILNQADLCLCEGRGLWLMARLIGKKLKQNIYGTDLIYNICKKSQIPMTNDQSNPKPQIPKVFLFGGTETVIKKTAEKLGERVIGYADGYQDLNRVIEKINLVKPDILLVGLGSPKQEKWIYYNLNKIPSVKLAIGIGGAFDYISRRVRRAPKFIQRIGLEWLWRLILQPRRIGKISRGVIGLIWLTFKNMLLLKDRK